MSLHAPREILSHEKRDAVVSLLLQHLRNELPSPIHNRVSRIIADCESCQLLYADMQDFFDPSDIAVFEAVHEDEIARNRSFLRAQASKHSVLRPQASVTFRPTNNLVDLLELEHDSICCGS